MADIIVYQPGFEQPGGGSFNQAQLGANYGFVDTPAGIVSADDFDVAWVGLYDNSRLLAAQPTGDLNRDGYEDIGFYLGAGSGIVAVFYGPFAETTSARRILRADQADTRIIADAGDQPAQTFGLRLDAPGDVDGDGWPDPLVSAPTAGLGDEVPIDGGAAWLFSGPLENVQSPDHATSRWVGCCTAGAVYAHSNDVGEDGHLERIHDERGRNDRTMQPTALLHEAWMKVTGSTCQYSSREHFLAVAARAMRQLLVDRARARMSLKRGGDWDRVTLSGVGDDPSAMLDVLSLDSALKKLAELDPVAADVAQLRTFGGMTVQETADALDISARSVNRKWRFATAVLAKAMDGG